MNALNPIKELYSLYSDKEETLWIMEIIDDGLRYDSDLEDGPLDPYLKL